MSSHVSLLDELAWRGLVYQHTDGIAAALAAGSVTGYVGFDPTASSLHVGHLVPIMALVHLQRAGHTPIALVGGGTGMIGDPSGRNSERSLLTLEAVEENVRGIQRQLEHFLDFEGAHAARMRNNAAWLLELRAIDFMRDVGKHFTVNYMMAKDSVKSRLDSGISYTEFSYMLLQAYDFLELHRREGVTLQMGGSDQWGNITAGIELVRRTTGGEAHGLTLPLVTTAAGTKFGKSESGAVWLDAARTSPYRFYQFWINTDDRDVGRFLRMFTLLAREEIEALEREVAEHPESRAAQRVLGEYMTSRLHGAEAARSAIAVSRVLFDKKADPRELSLDALRMLETEIPFQQLSWSAADDGAPAAEPSAHVLDLLTATGLTKSRGEARRVVQQGGMTVNGRRIGAEETAIAAGEAIQGCYFLVRKGAREMALVKAG